MTEYCKLSCKSGLYFTDGTVWLLYKVVCYKLIWSWTQTLEEKLFYLKEKLQNTGQNVPLQQIHSDHLKRNASDQSSCSVVSSVPSPNVFPSVEHPRYKQLSTMIRWVGIDFPSALASSHTRARRAHLSPSRLPSPLIMQKSISGSALSHPSERWGSLCGSEQDRSLVVLPVSLSLPPLAG